MEKTKSKGKKKSTQSEQKDEQNKITQKSLVFSMPPNKQLQLIKETHNRIAIAPENDIKHIETLFMLTKVSNLKIVTTALKVLAETFITISPLEPIDVKKIQERTSTKISKEEFKVIKFEKTLVEQYERYLKMLKELNMKIKQKDFKNDKQLFIEFKKCIMECLIKCYRTLWNFNCVKELNQLLMKFLKFQECRQFLKEILSDQNIAMISCKSRIISGISKIIINEEHELPEIIKILNCTFIDSQYLKKDMDSFTYKKKKFKKKLYKEQAFQAKNALEIKKKKKEQKTKEKLKIKEEVNKQFAEGEAIIKNKELVKHNTNILQQLFYLYFKIIVERSDSVYLRDSLDGILKYAHLINIELISSLIEHLNTSASLFRQYWKQTNKVSYLQLRMMIIFTGQSILNGPLSVYNMDDYKMTTHFYKLLRDINCKQISISSQLYRLVCISLQESFIKRRQLSFQIIGSFAREIAIFLHHKSVPKLYLLEFLRLLTYRYTKISRMFEEDNEGYGINSYNPMCEDPQCSNAINTQILTNLKGIKCRNEKQKRLVLDLTKQNFNQRLKESLQSILEEEMKEF